MHTPAHAVLNLTLLGRNSSTSYIWPVLIGSLLPDTPMFVFFFVERILLDTSPYVVWSERYFDPGWQMLIDVFNSIPLMLVGIAFAWRAGSTAAMLLFGSMLLHVAFDLPFHHDDGHRHFFPFLDWKFESPVSYWDPRFHGRIFSAVEAATVLVGCGVLFFRHTEVLLRFAIGVVAAHQLVEFGLGYRFYLQ